MVGSESVRPGDASVEGVKVGDVEEMTVAVGAVETMSDEEASVDDMRLDVEEVRDADEVSAGVASVVGVGVGVEVVET